MFSKTVRLTLFTAVFFAAVAGIYARGEEERVSLIGTEVRTPEQTTAAVDHIAFLSTTNNLDGLTAWLDYIFDQPGVRDWMAWFTNQIVVRGDELVESESYEPALIIYRSVPPRRQILDTQAAALNSMRKDLKTLEARVESEKNKPIHEHSNASELAGALKPAIELAEDAMKAIEEKSDLDAALLMRRGRCLFYLKRDEEALTCFRALHEKFPAATDAETAAYAEIMILNKRQDIEGIKDKSHQFMRKYPESHRLEQVGSLTGEVLVQSKNWKDVGEFYRGLETKFPKSEILDRYAFFQALAFFQDANFKESTPLFEKFIKNYASSPLAEVAYYYLAMSHFHSNELVKTIASCRDYLAKFPAGRFASDMQYRLSFIDFNDKEVDQTDKIIRELGGFLKENPDLSDGSILCLLADSYMKKMDKAKTNVERRANEDLALDAYKKAILTECPDEVFLYVYDNAMTILQDRKDLKGITELYRKIRGNFPGYWSGPNSGDRRYGPRGWSEILASILRSRIADPSCEYVEGVIDELVNDIQPHNKAKDIDLDALDKQLVDLLNKNIDKPNATSAARVLYARARLTQMLKRQDLSYLYMRGIATLNIKNPSALSPALLAASGDLLLKENDLDGAEIMFKYLSEHYKASMFSDAGPVGLGYVALGRKKPEEALRIFKNILENNPVTSRFKETTLGKLQALVELDKLEPATELALEMVGGKMFRGEASAKAYMQLGLIYRKQAAKADGEEARQFLAKAHGTYQRVYVAYQGFPEICAEAYWQASLVLKELKDDVQAQETLKALAEHPKLKDTARAKEAREMQK